MPTNNVTKVVLKNISRKKTILSLDFGNGESAILQYGDSISVEEKYLTPYIQRRINEGDLRLTKPIPIVETLQEEAKENEKPSNDSKSKKCPRKGVKIKKEVN